MDWRDKNESNAEFLIKKVGLLLHLFLLLQNILNTFLVLFVEYVYTVYIQQLSKSLPKRNASHFNTSF